MDIKRLLIAHLAQIELEREQIDRSHPGFQGELACLDSRADEVHSILEEIESAESPEGPEDDLPAETKARMEAAGCVTGNCDD